MNNGYYPPYEGYPPNPYESVESAPEGAYSEVSMESVEVVALRPSTATPALVDYAHRGREGQRENYAGYHRTHTSPLPVTVAENYSIPSEAPLLMVPTDLPLKDVVLLDVVASAVARGGPSVEEELAKKEENNPHFQFLQSKWDAPHLVYYRWRLYSLLQGDTLTSWRTEPYQIEQGPQAYVWVPPPLVEIGPDSLRAALTGQDRPQPSARWISYKISSERMFLVLLEEAAAEDWCGMLRIQERAPPYSSLSSSASGSTAPQSREAVAAHLEAWHAGWRRAVLHPVCIAECTIFAIEHNHAPHHVLSLLLDEFVRVAYDNSFRTRAVVEEDCVFRPFSQIESACASLTADSLQLLWLLFVLNDIIMNVSEEPLTNAAVAQMVNVEDQQRPTHPSLDDYLLPPVPPDPNEDTKGQHDAVRRRHRFCWVSAVETVLPTVIESIALVTMNTLHLTGTLTARSYSRGLAAELGLGVLSSKLDDDRYVEVHFSGAAAPGAAVLNAGDVGEREGVETLKANAADMALLVLSWLRCLLHQWSQASRGVSHQKPVVGARARAKLEERYSFLRVNEGELPLDEQEG